jgi:hypothetical protein
VHVPLRPPRQRPRSPRQGHGDVQGEAHPPGALKWHPFVGRPGEPGEGRAPLPP